jgi:hypothetical protein
MFQFLPKTPVHNFLLQKTKDLKPQPCAAKVPKNQKNPIHNKKNYFNITEDMKKVARVGDRVELKFVRGTLYIIQTKSDL